MGSFSRKVIKNMKKIVVTFLKSEFTRDDTFKSKEHPYFLTYHIYLFIYFNNIHNTEIRSENEHKQPKHPQNDVLHQMPSTTPKPIWPSKDHVQGNGKQYGKRRRTERSQQSNKRFNFRYNQRCQHHRQGKHGSHSDLGTVLSFR